MLTIVVLSMSSLVVLLTLMLFLQPKYVTPSLRSTSSPLCDVKIVRGDLSFARPKALISTSWPFWRVALDVIDSNSFGAV